MEQRQKERDYQKLVIERAPRSNVFAVCLKAFLVGGIICCIGQLIKDAGTAWFSFDEKELAAWDAIVLVFLGTTLTGIGIYDNIGSFAGAGSVVPITGFANSVAAPAIEFRPEGYVLGIGAKMFIIAGPVLVYGIGSSIIVGLLSLLVG